MMNEKDYIWLAGFLDGEGWFGIYPTFKTYKAEIAIETTSKEVAEWFRSYFEGSIYTRPLTSGRFNKKITYRFGLRSLVVIKEFLPNIIPYLKIKRSQAELLLAFTESKLKTRWKKKLDKKIREEHENFYKQIRILNGGLSERSIELPC